MSRRCMLTGKGVFVANNVSHANNKTKRRLKPNIRTLRVRMEDGTKLKLKVAASTLRSIKKNKMNISAM